MHDQTFEKKWFISIFTTALPLVLTVALFVGAIFFLAVPAMEDNLMAAKSETIRELVQTVWKLLQSYELRVNKGELTREQAKVRAIDHIRGLRYGAEGKDYFWINDMQPVMVMHPYRSDLEGRNLSEFVDSNGKHLFREFVSVAQKKGEGYVDYMWQWKDDPNRIVPKLSYVKRFKPWGWIIGTGIYTEDVHSRIDKITRNVTLFSLIILMVIILLSAFLVWQRGTIEKKQMLARKEKAKLEKQLQHSQRMEAIGTLAAGIAHDFNNIIAIILGNTELSLRDVPDSSPLHENLIAVKTAAHRAKEVVRQLQRFGSRRESERNPLNIIPIIKESLKFMRSTIPASVQIKPKIPPLSENILADATQMHQVLINLFTNAAHAMEANGGILEVSLEALDCPQKDTAMFHDLVSGRCLKLTIRDTGHGILPEHTDRIFEPYFTTKSMDKGTGMGLSVVHGIISAHDGRITVDSTPGEGSVFTIYLPVISTREIDVTAAAEDFPNGTESILLVDDEMLIVEASRKILENLGYSVTPFTSPAEALEAFHNHPDRFDIVVTDLSMPGMKGDKLVEEISRLRTDMPAIICTGFSEIPHNSEDTELQRPFTILEKPLSTQELAQAVRRMLDRFPGRSKI